jgi:hypothetical protein
VGRCAVHRKDYVQKGCLVLSIIVKKLSLITCSNKFVRGLAVALVLPLLLFLALDHEMCIALKFA